MNTSGRDPAAQDWCVSVPASSANLGAGFDVLGMALTLTAEVGCGLPPEGAVAAEASHPATVAFVQAGGSGPIWVRSPIPMSRGLGFSGAVRVGGAAAAMVHQHGAGSLDDPSVRAAIADIAVSLEGHADNAAASLHGGIVVAADKRVIRVPMGFEPAVLAWVPDASTTSTDSSRAALPGEVNRADAVFNLGRVAGFVAACAAGDVGELRWATDDRLHQPIRLAQVPRSAEALDAGLAAGAWAAWLSGSGPTVAMLCDPASADSIAAQLPDGGHVKRLRVDHAGATVTGVAGRAELGSSEHRSST